MEKECFKCGIIKPINEFYKHKEMGDGHLNKCKECTKKDVHTHRMENIEKVKEYDRNRPNKHERVLKNKERINGDPEKKKNYVLNQAEWSKKNKHKISAQRKLGRAVLNGTIKREYICSKCGSDKLIEAHHEDYLKPLDVVWLCSKCHHERHVELRKIEREKVKL